ncbi:uncharacterized protein LOC117125455 isoform X2 [Anneissia japonica]|uniref:uncharacterized protein LOC117125455 isoform X2 n=1 Tax=Anneissia japonica TaxID=1529436 RepID=UPI0014258B5C|nr:uncharacterized protein LOC117125455 isoform X2 [Anneissia japonica]
MLAMNESEIQLETAINNEMESQPETTQHENESRQFEITTPSRFGPKSKFDGNQVVMNVIWALFGQQIMQGCMPKNEARKVYANHRELQIFTFQQLYDKMRRMYPKYKSK